MRGHGLELLSIDLHPRAPDHGKVRAEVKGAELRQQLREAMAPCNFLWCAKVEAQLQHDKEQAARLAPPG